MDNPLIAGFFLVAPLAVVFIVGYKVGHTWGEDSQRVKDLEQFVETGRLEYGWKPGDK